MLTWSTSSSKPIAFRNSQSKAAEQFLDSWDGAVYDGKIMEDPELSREALIWRDKFPHLRVVGNCCDGTKSKKKTLINQSKSAITFREKSREPPSLPRIEKFKKKN